MVQWSRGQSVRPARSQAHTTKWFTSHSTFQVHVTGLHCSVYIYSLFSKPYIAYLKSQIMLLKNPQLCRLGFNHVH
jgi:hypothetical protein